MGLQELQDLAGQDAVTSNNSSPDVRSETKRVVATVSSPRKANKQSHLEVPEILE